MKNIPGMNHPGQHGLRLELQETYNNNKKRMVIHTSPTGGKEEKKEREESVSRLYYLAYFHSKNVM